MPTRRTPTRCRAAAALAVLLTFAPPSLARGAEPLPDRATAETTVDRVFRAGAFALDISPQEYPVIVNGSMTEHQEDKLLDPLHARCLVLDDGSHQAAIVVVDSCMMPRELLDRAKEAASQATGLRPDRMLISATHTHSAPSVMAVLGSRRDEAYARFLPGEIARCIKLAYDRLQPARVGWAQGRNEENVACRRWLMKPGSLGANPFGKLGERALMHPGHGNPNAMRPTGPVDPQVSVLAVQTASGRPLALLANYSLHYVGASNVSADYYGIFCDEMAKLLAVDRDPEGFVAMLSNGTSGDAWCSDYGQPKRKFDRFSVAKDVARTAHEAYQTIQFRDWAPLVMQERLLTLPVRMPTSNDVAQAKQILADVQAPPDGARLPRPDVLQQVYAGETLALAQMPPARELKLQAIRLGELGITAIPNEVFSSTGLAIKAQSPLATTFNISLANGSEGYIPPPDQHALGGYTTWRARTSCLEVNAEPQIRDAVLQLLNQVAKPPAKPPANVEPAPGPAAAEENHDPPDPAPQSVDARQRVSRPLEPHDALQHFRLPPGLRIELVAAEPLVVDPVAYDWGPDGKLWVVEMRDYPLGLPEDQATHAPQRPEEPVRPGGTIRCLEDTTGDGKYDRSTLFAEGLAFPNGISVWRDGIVVTAAPQILYLEDTTGDGHADVRQTLYDNVSTGNPQLRLNGLRWGLDGWLYCANGMSTVGEVRSVKTDRKLLIRGRDLRIHPDTGGMEPELGPAQFGRNRDDWGNWFGVSNANPMWHYVVGEKYLRRNPHLAVPDCRRDVSDTPGRANVFARSEQGVFYHESEVGRFTSANSAIIYCDELLGDAYAHNSFVSEPVHNLVHREIVQRRGVTFTSQRAPEEQQDEFLTSTDPWFRPNMLRTGPEGGLWIADIYREVIDHPEYIPQQRHAELDFRRGDTRGRIYRVLPADQSPRTVPNLLEKTDRELVALLENPNGTLRDLVQKQIVWRARTETTPLLARLAQQSGLPACRVQALWTLECLGALDAALVTEALRDAHPEVRRNAIQLAEGKFDESAQLGERLAELVDDPSLPVQMQLACTLGEWRDARAAELLARLALRHAADPLFRAAVLSSIHSDNVGPVTTAILAGPDDPPQSLLGELLQSALADRQPAVAAQALAAAVRPRDEQFADWQLGALTALYQACETHAATLTDLAKLAQPNEESTLQNLERMIQYVRQLADNKVQVHARQRLRAINLLGHVARTEPPDRTLLKQLITPRESAAVQIAAVEALASGKDPEIPAMLLGNWPSYSPGVRDAVLSALLPRADWTRRLLDAIDAGQVRLGELDAAQRDQLANHRSESLRKRVASLLAQDTPSDRRAVIDTFRPALQLPGDRTKGQAVFAAKCSNCHQLDGRGHSVGPDLAALTDRSPATLFTAVLDPNQAVDARYVNYVAVTDEGRTYAGILVRESDGSITLQGAEGKEQVLRRGSLEEIRYTGQSMMPDGLEQDLSAQDIADLLCYLAGPQAAAPVSSR
jgi:putative membrane-bound dehydrogenase-like protein